MKKTFTTAILSFLTMILFALTFTAGPAHAAKISYDLALYSLDHQISKSQLFGPPIPTPAAAASLASREGDKLLAQIAANVPDSVTYQVQSGDSLSRIASVFGTSINVLMDLNGLVDRNRLSIGQELKIPNFEKKGLTPDMEIQSVISADLTAYTAGPESTGKSPGHPAYGITASGKYVRDHHTIAVDPRVIPMGTRVYIEGIGVRVAEDTGGAIQGNRIDVYMSDLSAAIRFGYQKNVKVYILDTKQSA